MNNYTLINKSTGTKEILNPEEMRKRIQKTKGMFTDIYTYKVNPNMSMLERFFNNKIIIILFFLLCSLLLGVIFLEIFTNLIII